MSTSTTPIFAPRGYHPLMPDPEPMFDGVAPLAPEYGAEDDILYEQEVTDGTNTTRITVAVVEEGAYATMQTESNDGVLRTMLLRLTAERCDALANHLLDVANLLEEAQRDGRLA